MRIVQINYTYGNSDSTGRSTKELHQWLRKRGHDSYVFAAEINENTTKLSKKEIFLFSSKADRIIHAGFSRLTGLQGYYSIISTWLLIKKLKSVNPQIVVLRILHSNCINLPFLFRYLAEQNIATVLVLHDCWYFTGHCCHYTEDGCENWKKDCDMCLQMRNWNSSWFFDTAKKCLADKQKWYMKIRKLGVIGVSDWVTYEAEKSILRNADIIKRIYNWIDMSVFCPKNIEEVRKKYHVDTDVTVLIAVASGWSIRKGFREVVAIAKNHPDWKMLLVGNITSEMSKELSNNVTQVGVVENIYILAEYYAMADVFINPSVQETFGKTTAEALCCGTPVVVYNTTACTELVLEQCGKVVNCGSEREYAEAVNYVVEKGKSYYMQSCINFAHNNFDMECNIKQYLNLFRRLSSVE